MQQEEGKTLVEVESYTVTIQCGVFAGIAERAISLAPKASKFLILSDSNVGPLYGELLLAQFADVMPPHVSTFLQCFPAGEPSKTRDTKRDLEDWMLAQRFGRDSCLVALGGGVVGDLGGFLASTYMRSIPFIQVPTSFLAMVDSSVGGKTGVDTPSGKNLVGAFYRPLAVFIDPNLLASLPLRELLNGLAESIKAGAIIDAELFTYIESNVDRILKRDLSVLQHIIAVSVQLKARVVIEDEKEAGLREILNFGHTIGHAIEAMMQPALLHGECVCIGMLMEAALARAMGRLDSSSSLTRLHNLCHAFHLPTTLPVRLTGAAEALLENMRSDKKNKNGKIKCVMLERIGKTGASVVIEPQLLLHVVSPRVSLIPSATPVTGTLAVPGSKSISNRVLVMAALGEGTCRIEGLLSSEDTQVMLDALLQMGVQFSWEGTVLVVQGAKGALLRPQLPLYLNNAGTASRFLTSVCTLLPGPATLQGNARMHERPIGDLVDALRGNGQTIAYLGAQGCLPISVGGTFGLRGGQITLSPSVSSQYVSSVLLSAPYAQQDVELCLGPGPVVSEAYIDMTVRLMAQFGVRVEKDSVSRPDFLVYRVQRQTYSNPAVFSVEGDASSSTYALAMAAITGGPVTVTNVASNSLQGDASFCELLARMGCTVTQTHESTTVSRDISTPLRAIEGDVDMDRQTDAFMTLAVVAAVAVGTTRIVGIANQRVKECNRIAAMVTELEKCGVGCRELPTGIEIQGNAKPHGALIDCYGDHRIAMAFACLGTAVADIVITDKECVNKTYPEFWDHLSNRLGAQLSPAVDSFVKQEELAVPTVVVIGMRGAGKSTLSRHAAAVLGVPCFDLDAELERLVGCSIKDFVARESWPAFRAKELEVFLKYTERYPTGAVLCCGGGIVETPAALARLKQLPCVVEVRRDIRDICSYLGTDCTRPAYGDAADPRTVYERRAPLFAAAARYEFFTPVSNHAVCSQDLKATLQEFALFISTITGQSPHSAPRKCSSLQQGSFFLSLTFPDVSSAECLDCLDEASEGADCLELRVDLLRATDPSFVREQLAVLRRRSHLPVIFTVRSRGQGGAFPDDEPERMFALLALGRRLGCAFIDVESHWDNARFLAPFVAANQRRSTQLIVSAHEPKSNGGTLSALQALFDRCYLGGEADVVKVVVSASSEYDAFRILSVSEEWQRQIANPTLRVIVLAMGQAGQISRVMNRVLTPVTHPALPVAAAPGQLSVAEIMTARNVLDGKREFFLFGSPIGLSPSPAMHNAGFQRLGLGTQCHYALFETTDVEDVAAALSNPLFGGASVTMPLKEKVASMLSGVSEAARCIGAVNTIIRQADGSLVGDNTDWLGLMHPIRRARRDAEAKRSDIGLVIGAGGTARAALYALTNLGYTGENLVICNPRTTHNAARLAEEFQCRFVEKVDAVAGADVIICTLPGAVGFTLPTHFLACLPVVVDVSYSPKHTALLAQAEAAQCPVVRGIDMLVAQGVAAFDMWTRGRGHTASHAMDQAARAFYELKITK